MKIKKIDIIMCSNCFDKCNNVIEFDNSNKEENYLCDECLQELNRKIFDYLADKNI